MRRFLLAISVTVLCSAESGLTLENRRTEPGRGTVIDVVNHYSASATAYVIKFDIVKQGIVFPIKTQWVESIPGASTSGALAPGKSRTFSTGVGQWPPPDRVRVACVIFADGATEGESPCLQRLVGERAREFSDLPEARTQLVQVLAGALPVDKVVADAKAVNEKRKKTAEDNAAAAQKAVARLFKAWRENVPPDSDEAKFLAAQDWNLNSYLAGDIANSMSRVYQTVIVNLDKTGSDPTLAIKGVLNIFDRMQANAPANPPKLP